MKKKALVIGDIMLDRYSFGKIERQSPEDPSVPVFDITYEQSSLGGAGNVAKNLSALGMSVDICSLIHYDLTSLASEWDIDFFYWSMITNDRIEKHRIIDLSTGKQILRVDNKKRFEDIECKGFESKVIGKCLNKDFINTYDAIVISDYNKGMITEDLVVKIKEVYEKQIFVDTKSPEKAFWIDDKIILKINSHEFAKLRSIRPEIGFKQLLVTTGPEGCIHYEDGVETIYEPYNRVPDNEVDVIGAGDCFLAGLVRKWVDTKDIDLSISFANKVASKSVEKKGTSTVTFEEVE